MQKPTRRELVTSALLRGKEQHKNYTQPRTESSATAFGTVAVILKGDVFLISIQEVHVPSKKYYDDEYDVEELHTVLTLTEVEQLLRQRLGIELDELGPAKGIKRFR
ncbi:hypothetical protein GCM10023185_05950 [Hymenobacter saemangeumensis]|uniref:Uncharacterized protein n=1 Tax=Hymenobacter saemangeumensis TaxID=1084522 RepID=A0ABP8I1G5_9BACT